MFRRSSTCALDLVLVLVFLFVWFGEQVDRWTDGRGGEGRGMTFWGGERKFGEVEVENEDGVIGYEGMRV